MAFRVPITADKERSTGETNDREIESTHQNKTIKMSMMLTI